MFSAEDAGVDTPVVLSRFFNENRGLMNAGLRAVPLRVFALLIMVCVPVFGGSPDKAAEMAVAESSIKPEAPVGIDLEQLDSGDYVIGRIFVRVDDIFDLNNPDENRWLYRLANFLHISTRKDVILRLIYFAPGDPYSKRVLEESERHLRESRFLYDAEIRVVGVHGHEVDVEVVTRDVWTTRPGVSFGRSGGVNHSSVSIEEKNLLGRGKSIGLDISNSVDRRSTSLEYGDPDLFGSRFELNAAYADNSDGSVSRLKIQRPFFSLDTRWAVGMEVASTTQVDSLYNLGEITDQFQHKKKAVSAFFGISPGLIDGRSRRWSFGFTYDEHRFSPDFSIAPPIPVWIGSDDLMFDTFNDVGFVIPPDHTEAYPWIQYEVIEDSFLKAHNFDEIARTEDIELGFRLRSRVGYASTSLGATENALIFDLDLNDGWHPTKRRMFLASGKASGRIGNGQLNNFKVGGALSFYARDFGDHLFLIRARADAVHNLDPETQLLLGGDNGLRGYPLRYQQGDRRFTLTFEQRFFTDWNPFELANVGAAAFVDIGRAWFDGGDPNLKNDLLMDIGFGLRIAMSRTATGGVIHIDVAFPLERSGDIKGVQWLVSTHQSF